MCNLFPSTCKPQNLSDSLDFCKILNHISLFLMGLLRAPHSWFNQLKSLFRAKKKFAWFTLVYTGLHPFALRCAPSLSLPDGPHSPPKWWEYVYRTAHPVLRWLPTKLVGWIGENCRMGWDFPTKLIRGQSLAVVGPMQSWIIFCSLMLLLVPWCVEWESELCRGVMRARCYPFDMPKHCFHGMNPKVLYIHCTNKYIHVI